MRATGGRFGLMRPAPLTLAPAGRRHDADGNDARAGRLPDRRYGGQDARWRGRAGEWREILGCALGVPQDTVDNAAD